MTMTMVVIVAVYRMLALHEGLYPYLESSFKPEKW